MKGGESFISGRNVGFIKRTRERMKTAHSFLQFVSNLFHFIVLGFPI